METLEAALACAQAGWAVTPLSGKVPVVREWQARPFPSSPDIYEWFGEMGYNSFGVRCGAASGGLVVIDIEGRLMGDLSRMSELVKAAKVANINGTLSAAFAASAVTPSGGRHLFLACPGADPIPRNSKLCFASEGDGYSLLAEVRGEGGQVAVPPANGRKFATQGGYGVAVEVTPQELDLLLGAFRAIDESATTVRLSQPRRQSQFTTARPASIADLLSEALLRGELRWSDILDPGWEFVGWDDHGRSRWRRPDYGNKPTSLDSAHGFESYTELPSPVLVVHSSAVTHLPVGGGTRLTPGRVLAACWWDGDESRMYRDLEAGDFPDQLNLPSDTLADIAAFAERRRARVEAVSADDTDPLSDVRQEYERDIQRATYSSLVSMEGRDRATRILAGQGVVMPESVGNGRDYLALPDEETEWALEGLLPLYGNATLTAQFKAGKTTCVGDLVRCLCDDQPFLGKFAPSPLEGTVALWNYELSAANQRRWLRDLNIRNPEKMHVLDLRGHRWPFINERVEDLTVEWLIEREVEWWIIDPFARAFVGCGDENSNGDVSTWTDTIDVIKRRAGVKNVVMPVHTGRPSLGSNADVRARGATRLDDWADSRWLLVRDDQTDARFFRAHGRDVDVAEEELTMDATTRRLRLAGWDRHTHRQRTFVDRAVRVVADAGAGGATRTEVMSALDDIPKSDAKAAIDRAVASRRLDENASRLTLTFQGVTP